MLGHASATLTLDRDGHLFPCELAAVAARLDEAARQAGVYIMCTEADPMLFDEEVSDRKRLPDLRFYFVPPAGFEPATHGLGNRRSIP